MTGGVKQDILDKAKQQNIKVMPLLVNIIILKNGNEFNSNLGMKLILMFESRFQNFVNKF